MGPVNLDRSLTTPSIVLPSGDPNEAPKESFFSALIDGHGFSHIDAHVASMHSGHFCDESEMQTSFSHFPLFQKISLSRCVLCPYAQIKLA